jgi:hypothetical protein
MPYSNLETGPYRSCSVSKPIVQEIFEFLEKVFQISFFKVNAKLIEVVFPKIIWPS